MLWPSTIQRNCSSDFINFANFRPWISKVFLDHKNIFFSHRRSWQFWKKILLIQKVFQPIVLIIIPKGLVDMVIYADSISVFLVEMRKQFDDFFFLFLWRQCRHSSLDWVHNGSKIFFKSYLSLRFKKTELITYHVPVYVLQFWPTTTAFCRLQLLLGDILHSWFVYLNVKWVKSQKVLYFLYILQNTPRP